MIRPGLPRDPENEREAHRLAEHAVELDPLDARNQLAVAWTAALTGDFDRAQIHFDLASSLNPKTAQRPSFPAQWAAPLPANPSGARR